MGIKERRTLLKEHLRGEIQFIQTRLAELRDDLGRRQYLPPLTKEDQRALLAEIHFWKKEVQSRETKLDEIGT